MIQLEVTATGELLDLYPDTSVELELVNPAFTSADEGGSFSYPFDLPGTSTNHRITGHAYLLEKRDVLGISIRAKLSLFGLPVADGVLKITFPVSRERIRVYLVVNTFADLIKSKSLKDITYADREDFDLPVDVETHMGDAVAPGSKEYAFFPSLIGEVDDFFQNEFINAGGLGNFFSYFSESYITCVPHPYAYNVYKRLVEQQGYQFDDRFFSTATDLRNLVLYHHRVSRYDDALGKWYIDMLEAVPNVSASTYIRALSSMFGLVAYVDNRRLAYTLVPLASLVSAPHLEWTDRAAPGHEVTPLDDNGYTLNFDWSSDPLHENWFTFQFQTMIRRANNSYYKWENERSVGKREELNDVTMPADRETHWATEEKCFYFWQDSEWKRLAYNLKGTVADYATVVSPAEGDVWLSTDHDAYYIWLHRDEIFGGISDPEWFHFCFRRTDNLVIAAGETKKTASAHPVELHLRNYTNLTVPLPADKFMPAPGFLDRTAGEADKSIRLLIYRGLDATEYPGYRYPFATPDVYDTRGVKVGTHSLRWDGEHGLYEKFWRPWLDFLGSTRKVTRSLRLNAADIFNLDLTKQLRIENINYLIGKINVAITMQGITPARAELYTVGSGTEAAMSNTVGTAPAEGIGVMVVGTTNIVG
jgi:hypothetical protein